MVIVHEVVEFPAPHTGTGDDLSVMHILFTPGDDPLSHQVEVCVRKDFGMDAQIFFVVEVSQNGAGNPPDAHLDGGTVLHQVGNVFCNPFGHRAAFPVCDLQEGLFVLHETMHLGDMDKGVAKGTRHARIDLSDNDLSHLDGRFGDIHGDAQGTEPVFVGRGYLNETNVQSPGAFIAKEARNGREINGNIIDKAEVDGFPRTWTHEKCLEPAMFVELAPVFGKGSHRKVLYELQVPVSRYDFEQ